jgi:hypothetical protein|tara:strand:+ start:493 stop:597 length:105 start_codon:yes stop_codon:yes gene_type:complete
MRPLNRKENLNKNRGRSLKKNLKKRKKEIRNIKK